MCTRDSNFILLTSAGVKDVDAVDLSGSEDILCLFTDVGPFLDDSDFCVKAFCQLSDYLTTFSNNNAYLASSHEEGD